MAHKDNPYQNSKGQPQPGKMHQFFAFERDKEIERRKSLSADEVKELEAAENNLARKMNS